MEVDSSDKVHAEIARLTGEGLFTDEEIGTTCCFVTQDKVWVSGPAGQKWEIYTVLADSETFGRARSISTDRGTPKVMCAAAPPPRRRNRIEGTDGRRELVPLMSETLVSVARAGAADTGIPGA